jgi:phospholipid/cholesterol/gamma-HCH transport system substrate-binding protein
MQHTEKYKIRLGLFVAGGLILFMLAIFLLGRQNNLFNPVFKLSCMFKNVSGLQVGNNVRFSGINVGTVDNIIIVNDSTVQVDMLIKTSVKPFIKEDSKVIITSEGLIGDRLLSITQGSPDAPSVHEGQQLDTNEPIETNTIMTGLQVTIENTEVITGELAEIMYKINNGRGTLGRLIQDSTLADNLTQTIVNLKKGSKGLDENMKAARNNFLLKGYFNKKAKAAEKKKKEEKEKLEAQQNLMEEKKEK